MPIFLEGNDVAEEKPKERKPPIAGEYEYRPKFYK